MSKSRIIIVLSIALALAGGAPALAHNVNMTDWLRMIEKLRLRQPDPQQTPWLKARVVKVDAAAQSVTISHDAIRSVGMPAMTMTFGVTDPSRLAALKKGQRVDIQVENVDGTGKIVSLRAPQTPQAARPQAAPAHGHSHHH